MFLLVASLWSQHRAASEAWTVGFASKLASNPVLILFQSAMKLCMMDVITSISVALDLAIPKLKNPCYSLEP